MITNATLEFLRKVRKELGQKKSLANINRLLLEIWEAGYAQAMKDSTNRLKDTVQHAYDIANTSNTVDGVGIQPSGDESSGGDGIYADDADSVEGSADPVQAAPAGLEDGPADQRALWDAAAESLFEGSPK